MWIFTYLLAAIWSISLLVWWIWVMNIMLVSVTERTREIWIRKAIWALNADIITQFLIESVVVTAIGWVIAIILAWLAIQLVNSFHIEWINVSMTGSVVVLATTLTFIIWIVSWIGPAKKAAELQPIDALRFE
jgi:ABC-type antimicrobial peptide transport system permease subunit